MPFYDFYCKKCDYTEELFLKMSDDAPLCNKCQERMDKKPSVCHAQPIGKGTWRFEKYSK